MHKKMMAVLSRLTGTAKMFLPAGLIELLLEMAAELDSLRAENQKLKEKGIFK
jgi:hypothetical protein